MQLSDAGIERVQIRRAVMGGIILEVPDEDNKKKADDLAIVGLEYLDLPRGWNSE